MVHHMTTPTIRPFYDMWPQYNRRLRDVIGGMSLEQLAIRPSPDRWPIWAIAGHTAAARVYWLCDVIGEPGAETTPFTDAANSSWEDDLDHPRDADELVGALDSTWRLIEGCLYRWTPDMMADEFSREHHGSPQVQTRSSILQRLLTHDAYHCGELSQMLGIAGLPQIDLWVLES
jgi:uncharacterized damage-inducible protein DinB